MNKIIEDLNWRYATKAFDKNKKVSKEDLDTIIEAFRLSPSSFWLEPWKLIIVENTETREKLLEHSWNQKQIVDASHLLVFTRVNDIKSSHMDKFLDNNSKISWASREDLKWYENMMKGYFSPMDENSLKLWSHEQINIALWFVMSVLSRLRIDSCAVWGFNPEKYDEILWLKEKWLSSVVVLPIWYRDESDKYISKPKIRFPKEQVFEVIK